MPVGSKFKFTKEISFNDTNYKSYRTKIIKIVESDLNYIFAKINSTVVKINIDNFKMLIKTPIETLKEIVVDERKEKLKNILKNC